jgi:hypothetical protein
LPPSHIFAHGNRVPSPDKRIIPLKSPVHWARFPILPIKAGLEPPGGTRTIKMICCSAGRESWDQRS